MEIDYYEYLEALCKNRWKELGSAVFNDVPDFIFKSFALFLENPLCIAVLSILLVVAAFALVGKIIAAIRSRG